MQVSVAQTETGVLDKAVAYIATTALSIPHIAIAQAA
jgi:hypothetical protein